MYWHKFPVGIILKKSCGRHFGSHFLYSYLNDCVHVHQNYTTKGILYKHRKMSESVSEKNLNWFVWTAPTLPLRICFQGVAYYQGCVSIHCNWQLLSKPFQLLPRNLRICEAKRWTLQKMKPYKSSLDTFTCSINWVCFLSDRLRERKTRAIWICGTPRKVPYHCWRKKAIKCSFAKNRENGQDLFLCRSSVVVGLWIEVDESMEGISLSWILL